MHLLFTSASSWKLTRKTTAGFLECKRKLITVSFLGLSFPAWIPRPVPVTVTCEDCASENMQTRNELPSLESAQWSFVTPQLRETHGIPKLPLLHSSMGGSFAGGNILGHPFCEAKCPILCLYGTVKTCSISFCSFIILLLRGFLVPKNVPSVSQQKAHLKRKMRFKEQV